MVVAAFISISNASSNVDFLQVVTYKGYYCDFSIEALGHNYSSCITDSQSYGDNNNGLSPWCYYGDGHPGEWDYCQGHWWTVSFDRYSAISTFAGDKDRLYTFWPNKHFLPEKFPDISQNKIKNLTIESVADFRTDFEVVKSNNTDTGYEIVVPEVGTVKYSIYEESMENLQTILSPFKGRTDLVNWWVRDVNGNNKDYCISYNRIDHVVQTRNCSDGPLAILIEKKVGAPFSSRTSAHLKKIAEASITISDLQIRTDNGYECDFRGEEFGYFRYHSCITDSKRYGDNGNGEEPWCRVNEGNRWKDGRRWDFCHDYEYKVKFGSSVLSNLTNDNSDRFYKFTQGLPTLNYQQAVNAAASRGGVLADFKTNFTVEEDSKSAFGYKIVVPDEWENRKVRKIYEESMNNLKQILGPFEGRSDLVNWWVRDVNERFCISYNRISHVVQVAECTDYMWVMMEKRA